MADDYTSWWSLNDRTFTGRHLPPATPSMLADLPSDTEVKELFRREQESPSTDTSVLFMFFAQWFTDSFLRTDRTDFRKNTSNHEIDLCQIYGLTQPKTAMLRSGQGGRLKSQDIDGEEYPEFLFEPRSAGEQLVIKPEFEGLHDEQFIRDILRAVPEERRDTFFAVGTETGNSSIGTTSLNIVFLREHNRVAGVLGGQYPDWNDQRLFETARNIMIVIMIKLVVEEYIRHIGPADFPIEVVPFIADGERWNRSNWMAIEFNLLYRWHPLVPDTISDGSGRVEMREALGNNALVIERGVDSLIALCSRSRAGKMGLGNTPSFLVDRSPDSPYYPSVEERTIALMRKARLCSFNDYRRAFNLEPLTSFGELTSNVSLRRRLEALYGHIDKLEWYVGIFAENYGGSSMMGQLMTTMVAYDAFTQALTNPLLARNVFKEHTFSPAGVQIIKETNSLQQILARNSRRPEEVYASFSVSPASRRRPELTRTLVPTSG
jgi:prostaglandin-endoperoxide synthase 2